MDRNITEQMRSNYETRQLDKSQLTADPMDLMKQWFSHAIEMKISEATAMILSTVSEEGQPSSRTVLLKEIDERGFIFYTNYQSRKARDLTHNDKVSLIFFWKELEQQVRIEGKAYKISASKSKEYFQSRPKGSQLGAWASPQSKPIADRSALENRLEELREIYANHEKLPLPAHWGGYRVIPHYFEFWQGRPDRLHDRFAYNQVDQKWVINRLAP